ncbi:hypothetical protein B0H13DRAFT_2307440 [Mycena leptocephala]|nr:hypothetical protein B0H13DRAFT_2307440 [Mycena leptocephala]
MAVVDDMPTELLLELIPYFCLKSLIAGRLVCQLWRSLIPGDHIKLATPLADIDPARLRLLQLYDRLCKSDVVNERAWTLENLKPFDRQAYLDALLDQHDDLPEEFRLWILEWPARAAINCYWPGLPDTYCSRVLPLNMADPTTLWHELRGPREWGVDPTWVAVTGTTSDGPLPDDDVSPDDWLDVPALLVHHDGCTKTWLVLDARRRLPFNVFRLQHEDYDGGRAEGFNIHQEPDDAYPLVFSLYYALILILHQCQVVDVVNCGPSIN